MLRNSSARLLRLGASTFQQQLGAASSTCYEQLRHIGTDKVPEYWGKASPYTEGTAFLGTPKNHQELIQKRPLSPDVLDIDMKTRHYAFPFAALSSITNRVTGVAMSVGFTTAGYISLMGNLPGLVSAIADTNGIILFPFKFAVAYTILFHYLGGLRHFVWDHHKIGNQADEKSLLEKEKVEISSKALFAGSAALAFIVACL